MARNSFGTIVCVAGLVLYTFVIVSIILAASCWEILFAGTIGGDGDRGNRSFGTLRLAGSRVGWL